MLVRNVQEIQEKRYEAQIDELLDSYMYACVYIYIYVCIFDSFPLK